MKLFYSFILFFILSFLSCKKENTDNTATLCKWETLAPMNYGRHNFGLTVCNDTIYAIGGYNTSELNVVEAYDPTENIWYLKTEMPTARGYLIVESYNNKIYAIGGVSGGPNNITYENVTEMYDPNMDIWTTLEPIPISTSTNSILGNEFICSGIVNGYIYVAVFNAAKTLMYIYDINQNIWTEHNCGYVQTGFTPFSSAVLENILYACGGELVLKFDANLNTWITIPPMNETREYGCLVASSEFLYMIGGRTINESHDGYYAFSTVDIYDPMNTSWSKESDLSTPRYSASAVYYEGYLYVAGGQKISNNFYPYPIALMERLKL